jgi:hypothetical protein
MCCECHAPFKSRLGETIASDAAQVLQRPVPWNLIYLASSMKWDTDPSIRSWAQLAQMMAEAELLITDNQLANTVKYSICGIHT